MPTGRSDHGGASGRAAILLIVAVAGGVLLSGLYALGPAAGPPTRSTPAFAAAPDAAGTPAAPPGIGPAELQRARRPVLPLITGTARLPGEAVWVPAAQKVTGAPAAWSTFFRPQQRFPNVRAGVLWLDQTRVATTLVPGVREPGPVVGGWPGQVPAAARPALVATWVAGYQFKDAPGGFALGPAAAVPLVAGRASLVIDSHGRIDVRAWAGGTTGGQGVSAVRQNLLLVVDHGRPAAGLGAAPSWGSIGQQRQYTGRTGVGVTAGGDVVVVEALNMTLAGIADLLVSAGAVRGMQLDIHDAQVTVNTYPPGPSGVPHPDRLLGTTRRPAARYLKPDNRDFVAAFVRGTPLPFQAP